MNQRTRLLELAVEGVKLNDELAEAGDEVLEAVQGREFGSEAEQMQFCIELAAKLLADKRAFVETTRARAAEVRGELQ